jgi:hypothetical protein
MTHSQFLFLKILSISIILLASIRKYIFWKKAKNEFVELKPFLIHFFVWYSVYAIYDSGNFGLGGFMEVSNKTNVFIWLSILLLTAALILQKFPVILID